MTDIDLSPDELARFIAFLLARLDDDEVASSRTPAELDAVRHLIRVAVQAFRDHDLVLRNGGRSSKPESARLLGKGEGKCWGLLFSVQSLALTYADHRDYRDPWRPY